MVMNWLVNQLGPTDTAGYGIGDGGTSSAAADLECLEAMLARLGATGSAVEEFNGNWPPATAQANEQPSITQRPIAGSIPTLPAMPNGSWTIPPGRSAMGEEPRLGTSPNALDPSKFNRADPPAIAPTPMSPNGRQAAGGAVGDPPALGIEAPGRAMRELHRERDLNGTEHIRYQLQIHGLDVVGATRNEHRLGDGSSSAFGESLEELPTDLTSTATITEATALQAALSWVGAAAYKWEFAEEEAFLKADSGDPTASFKPKGTLVYYGSDPSRPTAQLHLAYCFDIYAQDPPSRQLVYVDATTGEVVGENEIFNAAYVSGTAKTGYCGTRTIATDQTSSTSYRLRTLTGGGTTSPTKRQIETYNLKNSTLYFKAVDFTDTNNVWGVSDTYTTSKDKYALDAHYGAEQTYDFYRAYFNRYSIDNLGFTLKSYVHYSNNYFNAFWDGSRMVYGDGSSLNGNLPLTSLDVCGHEITHGLTSKTSNLTYSGESGALNESFSDIFGTCIEAYGRGRTNIGSNSGAWNWTIGEDFKYIIRDMANPKAYSNPDTYKGQFWYSGTNDNGGVHTNSGPLNYWFVLLAEGSGQVLNSLDPTASKEHSSIDIDGTLDTNDNGYRFSVRGLGLDKAQAVAYRTLTTYLNSSSNYLAARTQSLKAAADFLSSNPYTSTGVTLTRDDLVQLQYAWDAVGVGGGTSASFRSSFTGADGKNDGIQGGQLDDIICGTTLGTGLTEIDVLTGNGSGFAVNNDRDLFVLGSSTNCFYAASMASDYASITDFNETYDQVSLYKGSTYYYLDDSNGNRILYLEKDNVDGLSTTSDDMIATLSKPGGTFTPTTSAQTLISAANIPNWVTWA